MTPEEKTNLENRVKEVIESIRPYLQEDGGDVQFVSMDENKIVYVGLQGHCGSCPHALATLKQGVEAAVREVVPEIQSVERI